MTKISPRRSKGTLLAMLSFGAALASCLVASPATAQSMPTTASVVYEAGSTLPAGATQFASDAGTLASAHCDDRRACVFSGANYTGVKISIPATSVTIGQWGEANFTIRSAKNTFDNRRVQIGHRRADGSHKVVRCLNPNTKRPGPFPDGSNSIRIGRLGSRC